MQKLEKRGLPGCLDYENDISRRKAKESGFDEVRQVKARFIQLKRGSSGNNIELGPGQ
jgi:hypothetical protein